MRATSSPSTARTRDERLHALLAGVPLAERLRLLPAAEAATLLGVSVPTIYRYASEGRLAHVKSEGRERRGGRGRAGALRFRLLDLVAYQVANERAAS